MTVNTRILAVKNSLNLSDVEFAQRAQISTGTLHRIKKNEVLSQKTLNGIADALGLDRNWLSSGQGERFASVLAPETKQDNPWKDALVQQVKEENSRLQKEVERLWTMVGHLAGGKEGAKLNFHKLFDFGQLAIAGDRGARV